MDMPPRAVGAYLGLEVFDPGFSEAHMRTYASNFHAQLMHTHVIWGLYRENGE